MKVKVIIWKDERHRRKDKWTVTVKLGARVSHTRFPTRAKARTFRRQLKAVLP